MKGMNHTMKKTVGLLILVMLLVIGGGVGYYFYNEAVTYLSTENAQVTARFISLTPMGSGKLTEWDVEQGDIVHENQILGKQEGSPNIKSPMDGEIMKVNVVKDQVVTPATELAIIAQTGDTYIRANIEETQISRVNQGQQVEISIDAYPGKKFKGYVDSIDDATQQAFNKGLSLTTSGTFTKTTQLIPVRINIDTEGEYALKLGMNATVKINVGQGGAGK